MLTTTIPKENESQDKDSFIASDDDCDNNRDESFHEEDIQECESEKSTSEDDDDDNKVDTQLPVEPEDKNKQVEETPAVSTTIKPKEAKPEEVKKTKTKPRTTTTTTTTTVSTVKTETKEAIAVQDGVIIQGHGLQASGSKRKVGERNVATFNPNKPTAIKASEELFTRFLQLKPMSKKLRLFSPQQASRSKEPKEQDPPMVSLRNLVIIESSESPPSRREQHDKARSKNQRTNRSTEIPIFVTKLPITELPNPETPKEKPNI